MKKSREGRFLLIFIAFYLILISLPFIYAWRAGGESHVFAGFLVNPVDGNTYLAKMRQGYCGEWTFTLPYSHEAGEGAFINMFYIFAGHLARITGWSLILTFHLLRVIGAVFLLLVLYQLCRQVFKEQSLFRTAFILAALGSGLGWAALAFGVITSDLWVAEGYPFLASFTNPHFPFGMALQLWLLTDLTKDNGGWVKYIKIALASLALALISPFGLVVVLAVGGGLVVWRLIEREGWQPLMSKWAAMIIFGVPLLAYYYWISHTHPVLAVWSVQNLTVTPPWWDLLISFSPAVLFAIPGIWLAVKDNDRVKNMLAVWLVVCIILVYLPFSLQRRFLHGLYLPIALVAVIAVRGLSGMGDKTRSRLTTALLFLSLTGSALIILMGFNGVRTLDSRLYLTQEEHKALRWVDANLPEDSLFLASPDSGLFLPAYSRVRVLYGHPYETVHADRLKAAVQQAYSGEISLSELMAKYPVDYVYYGPRERALGHPSWLSQLTAVYSSGEVVIYDVEQ